MRPAFARSDLGFRIYIHQSADVAGAQKFWTQVTDAPLEQFHAPTIKHHNPKTVRKNVGEDYHGCLRIDVLRGADLYRRIEGWYRRIEGWAAAITSGSGPANIQSANGQASNSDVLPDEDSNLG